MSSRILRGDASASISSLVFRTPAGQPQQLRPRPSVAVQAQDSDPSVGEADVRAREEAAWKRGFAEGETRGTQQAAARVDPVIHNWTRMVEDLASQRKRLRAEAEEDTVKLALAIARRVMHRELATDSEAIMGLVAAASTKLNTRDLHRLRLSPADAATVEGHRNRLNLPSAVSIVADASLIAGSAIFETSRGEMDASIDTQLSEIEHGLADVIRRRTR